VMQCAHRQTGAPGQFSDFEKHVGSIHAQRDSASGQTDALRSRGVDAVSLKSLMEVVKVDIRPRAPWWAVGRE
jgi:hypothetical protein